MTIIKIVYCIILVSLDICLIQQHALTQRAHNCWFLSPNVLLSWHSSGILRYWARLQRQRRMFSWNAWLQAKFLSKKIPHLGPPQKYTSLIFFVKLFSSVQHSALRSLIRYIDRLKPNLINCEKYHLMGAFYYLIWFINDFLNIIGIREQSA